MSIKENVAIPVYNYNEYYICLPTNVTTHMLPPATDGTPSVDYLSANEISYINGISDCFRTGLIQFDDENKEDIYSEIIKFADWRSIITNEEIEDILLNPTMDGLQKIINITNQSVFDRIRAIYVRIKENDEEDLSNRVIKIMDTRYSEFRKGILRTAIEIKAKDSSINKSVSTEEIDAVKEQNTILMAQLAEMQKMLAEMKNVNTEVESSTVESEKKTVGRPPNKK